MGAEFSIEGSVSGFSPYSDVGKDIEPGETVTLKLENPGTVSQVRFDIEFKSTSYVPSITLSPPSGMPAKPSDDVTFVAPVDVVASYKIRCITGDGTADGAVKSRIVAIRSAIGLRHVIVTERDEYQRPYGWAEAINETVDQTVAAVGGDITGPGASTDGAIATWNGASGNQLRNNSLAIIPPGTGRLQLTERIELGDSPTDNGLNLEQLYGVSWNTELGAARAIGIENGTDLTIGDVTNIDYVLLQAKASKAVNVDIGGTTELAVETGRARVSNELKLTGKLKMGPTPPDGTGINLSTTQPITGETVAPDAGQAHMMSVDASNRLLLGENGNLGDVYIRTRTGNNVYVEIGGANKLTVGSSLVSVSSSLSIGAVPAPSGTLALPKTASVRASNQGEDDYVPMIATDAGDQLLLGGNYVGNKGMRLDVQTGYIIAAAIAGTTELSVEAGKVVVVHNLEVQGGEAWVPLEPIYYEMLTTRITTNDVDLEDITGASVAVTLPAECRLICEMHCQTSAGTTSCTGLWAININGVDKTTMGRTMSGVSDIGSVSVMASADLAAGGPYTVKGRHRRAGGAGTVQTEKVQLIVRVYVKPV